MEERYRNLTAAQSSVGSNASKPAQQKHKQGTAAVPAVVPEKPKQSSAAVLVSPDAPPETKCACHRLAMYVLDISRAISDEPEVEWLPFRSNASLAAPEETILYTLVSGRSELIMFGGIQKDVSTIASGRNASSETDTVFNDVYFLTPPIQVV